MQELCINPIQNLAKPALEQSVPSEMFSLQRLLRKNIDLYFSFVVGERFRLHENQILCESDWRELKLFSQAAYNDRSLNQIARNLREMPDFQPVRFSL
ncbi:unnamed protein product [Cylicostephanus goldi]|uniref:Uncharacterized protein n=1 Tax=Cylicostephanus goldi TaxID=71465 RepID=A0A3P6T180_CYLGO|nr:unnamed protein product [Cylicostephanus goldi]